MALFLSSVYVLCVCVYVYTCVYTYIHISSGLKVTSAQGSLQRSEVATTCTSSLHRQNVKLLPIISSQGGANNNDRQAT